MIRSLNGPTGYEGKVVLLVPAIKSCVVERRLLGPMRESLGFLERADIKRFDKGWENRALKNAGWDILRASADTTVAADEGKFMDILASGALASILGMRNQDLYMDRDLLKYPILPESASGMVYEPVEGDFRITPALGEGDGLYVNVNFSYEGGLLLERDEYAFFRQAMLNGSFLAGLFNRKGPEVTDKINTSGCDLPYADDSVKPSSVAWRYERKEWINAKDGIISAILPFLEKRFGGNAADFYLPHLEVTEYDAARCLFYNLPDVAWGYNRVSLVDHKSLEIHDLRWGEQQLQNGQYEHEADLIAGLKLAGSQVSAYDYIAQMLWPIE